MVPPPQRGRSGRAGLAGAVVWLCLSSALGAPSSPAGTPPTDDALRVLPELEVVGDATEQEVWPEEQADVFPFGRNALLNQLVADREADAADFVAIEEQLAAATEERSTEFASVAGAAAPRGFTTPRLRNGFTQLGFPEVIIGGRRDLLTGFLATFYGRTAPGGIVNHISRRPPPRTTKVGEVRVSSLPSVALAWERGGALGAKSRHGRLVVNALTRAGPEESAFRDEWTGGLSLRLAPNRRTTLLLEVETAQAVANAGSGVPRIRTTRGAKQGGPWLALADFNTNGPDARSRRESVSVATVVERRLGKEWSLRAGAQWWERALEDHRFVTGPFLVDEQVFDGVREPDFNVRREDSAGVQVEIDGRLRTPRGDHRFVAGIEASRAQGERERRLLPVAERNRLPAGVQRLDPAAPDFTLPPFSPEVYSRLAVARRDGSDFGGLFVNDRFSLGDGRWNGTLGLRHDRVLADVEDRRAGAVVPEARTTVGRTTGHAGVVWARENGRLAWFANHSTAFQPQRRVDARTGRILANEGTVGLETGLRWQDRGKHWVVSSALFRLWNRDITRPNPFYDDPLFDPDRTQPQWVASGEERFTGAESTVRWTPSPGLTASVRGTWLEAITTRSPDLPEEVGRQLTRQPEWSAGGSLRYSLREGRWSGLATQVALAWVGRLQESYENARQLAVGFGSYLVVNVSADYVWEARKRQHTVGAALRNALDRDLPAATGRAGGEAALELRYRLQL